MSRDGVHALTRASMQRARPRIAANAVSRRRNMEPNPRPLLTFVACDGSRIAGYFSLNVGQVDTLDTPERVRRGMGQQPIPLVILARLAVDLDYQKQGLGFSLLQDAIRRTVAIAEHAGIRALLIHPIDEDADAFYRRFGFESTPATNIN